MQSVEFEKERNSTWQKNTIFNIVSISIALTSLAAALF